MPCSELTGSALAFGKRRVQHRAGGYMYTGLQGAVAELRQEFGDGARRHRIEEARMHHFEQVLRELRVACIEFQLNTSRQKREGLDEPLHIRIRYIECVHTQACRDTRVGTGKLRAGLAQEPQFRVVVFEQSRIHGSTGLVVGDHDVRGLDIDLSTQQQLLRCWLPPQLRFHAKFQRVQIHPRGIEFRRDAHVCQPRFEALDRGLQPFRGFHRIEVAAAKAGDARQAVVQHRADDLRPCGQVFPRVKTGGTEEP